MTDFGVAALGITAQEWTSSTAPNGLGNPAQTAIVRGGGAGPAALHRCAARAAKTADSRSQDLGFRCCQGPMAKLTYPSEAKRAPIEELDADESELRAALRSIPQLSQLAGSFSSFDTGEVNAALRRGGRSRDGIRLWSFPSVPFAWSPVDGELLWVISGQTDEGALLALLHPLPDGSFTHAASTLISEQEATVAIGWNPEYRQQLVFSTCWNCPGAGGIAVLGEYGRVSFAYR